MWQCQCEHILMEKSGTSKKNWVCLPCYTSDETRTECAVKSMVCGLTLLPQRSTRAIPCISPQANLHKNPATNFTAHGAHYTTYNSNAIPALGALQHRTGTLIRSNRMLTITSVLGPMCVSTTNTLHVQPAPYP